MYGVPQVRSSENIWRTFNVACVRPGVVVWRQWMALLRWGAGASTRRQIETPLRLPIDRRPSISSGSGDEYTGLPIIRVLVSFAPISTRMIHDTPPTKVGYGGTAASRNRSLALSLSLSSFWYVNTVQTASSREQTAAYNH